MRWFSLCFCFEANKPKPSDVSQCRASAVHNDVTLVGGINAGKFTDLGNADNMSLCTQRCCMKSACDVAFMLENECYGVSCLNESLCESRPARNPARYNPRIVYVYHDTKKDKGKFVDYSCSSLYFVIISVDYWLKKIEKSHCWGHT